ncbi:MAG TPA: YbfB/YjiJ family MFS transporter [Burkholderiales bacterium]
MRRATCWSPIWRTAVSPSADSRSFGAAGVTALAGLLALALAQGIGRFAFTPILPMMQEDAGVSLAEGGWLAAANYLGYLVGALWAMVQPARSDHAIRAALAITSAATLAMGLVEGFAAWLALRALAGISSAWALIHMSSWSAHRLARLGRPAFNGIVFAGVGAGIVLAGGLCLVLMTASAGSRAAWLWFGAIGVLITVMVWPVVRDAESAAKSQAFAGYRWTRDTVRLVACYGAFGIGYIIPATFVPVMAKQVIDDPAVFGWAWPLFGAAAVASTLLAGALDRVISGRRLWMASACVMALGVASPLFISGLGGILACALLVGGTFVVATLAGVQVAREVSGGEAHVLMAAMTASFAASQVVGPLIVSYFVQHSAGFSGALLLACAVLTASAAGLMIPLRDH